MEKQRAVVCFYRADRGYGFLSTGTGKTFQKWFFHFKQYPAGVVPVVGTAVLFDVNPVQSGPYLAAENIEIEIVPEVKS